MEITKSIKEKESILYEWKLKKPEDVRIVIITIDGKTGKIIK